MSWIYVATFESSNCQRETILENWATRIFFFVSYDHLLSLPELVTQKWGPHGIPAATHINNLESFIYYKYFF